MLIISDVHEKWGHPRAVEHCLRTRDEYKCDTVVSIGDFCDWHSMSTKYKPHPDMPSSNDEIEQTIEAMQRWYNNFDTVDVCESNHEIRPFLKAHASGIPSRVLRDYAEVMQYPAGWRLREIQFEIDEVIYTHGIGFTDSSWKSAHNKLKASCVFGHTHRGGVIYSQSRKARHFSLNVGALLDPRAKVFDYARYTAERAMLGCGVVIDGEAAYFVPMSESVANDFS